MFRHAMVGPTTSELYESIAACLDPVRDRLVKEVGQLVDRTVLQKQAHQHQIENGIDLDALSMLRRENADLIKRLAKQEGSCSYHNGFSNGYSNGYSNGHSNGSPNGVYDCPSDDDEDLPPNNNTACRPVPVTLPGVTCRQKTPCQQLVEEAEVLGSKVALPMFSVLPVGPVPTQLSVDLEAPLPVVRLDESSPRGTTPRNSISNRTIVLSSEKSEKNEKDNPGELSFFNGRFSGKSSRALVDARAASKKSATSSCSMVSGNLDLLPVWIAPISSPTVKRMQSGSIRSEKAGYEARSYNTPGSKKDNGHFIIADKGCLQKFILNPTSAICIAWDVITAVAVFHDTITVPIDLGFEPMWPPPLHLLSRIVSFVWVFDLFFSFFRGVVDDERGVIEMRPLMIAKKYLKGWFFFDFAIVAADVSGDALEGSRVMRIMRLQRIIRLLRLLRLLRVAKAVFNALHKNSDDNQTTEKGSVIFGIVKLLIILILMNHFLACAWYAVGGAKLGASHWTDDAFREDSTFAYRYLTSYHWSLTQFTPASMEVSPANAAERLFTIFVITIGLLVFSSFVSRVTQAMMTLWKLSADRRTQTQAVRRYLTENKISLELGSRIINITRSCKKTTASRRIYEKDVVAFKFLTHEVLAKLHEEVFAPIIIPHGVFKMLHDSSFGVFGSMCHIAITEKPLLYMEELFRCGLHGNSMYFITGGALSYFHGFETEEDASIHPGAWISEPPLWTHWEHRGRIIGKEAHSDLLAVDAAQFCKIASISSCSRELQQYAKLFARVCVKSSGGLDLVSDLWSNCERVDELMRAVEQFCDDERDEKLYPSRFTLTRKLIKMWDPELVLKTSFEGWKDLSARRKALEKRHQFFAKLCPWLFRKSTKKKFLERHHTNELTKDLALCSQDLNGGFFLSKTFSDTNGSSGSRDDRPSPSRLPSGDVMEAAKEPTGSGGQNILEPAPPKKQLLHIDLGTPTGSDWSKTVGV
eukprot:TRINITY_DN122109_c0_g1_i1.p1 TRINITY_DN122109_c0_g1~~TRINITY_DN122109_c0_g1_i1.p1  ORF type:complete len:981 (+),score=211.14 TRINITY_DN122109_c0_g1_i1:60-3002(+)